MVMRLVDELKCSKVRPEMKLVESWHAEIQNSGTSLGGGQKWTQMEGVRTAKSALQHHGLSSVQCRQGLGVSQEAGCVRSPVAGSGKLSLSKWIN